MSRSQRDKAIGKVALRELYVVPSGRADNMTETGARHLAWRIEDYWHRAGKHWVKAWIEDMGRMEDHKVYAVRSNLLFLGGRGPVPLVE